MYLVKSGSIRSKGEPRKRLRASLLAASRRLSFACLLLATTLLVAGSAFAHTAGQVTVTAPTMFAAVGSDFEIAVQTTDTTGLNIISFQGDLIYDPAVITPQVSPIDTVGTISSGMTVTFNPIAPGILKFAFFTATPRVGAGTLVKFRFTAVGAAGNVSPLSWVDFFFNENNPTSKPVAGSVTLVGPTSAGVAVSGRVVDANGRPIRGAVVELASPNGERRVATSSGFGYFQFEDVAVGTTYVMRPSARGFSFQSRLVSVTDQITDLTLSAEPIE